MHSKRYVDYLIWKDTFCHLDTSISREVAERRGKRFDIWATLFQSTRFIISTPPFRGWRVFDVEIVCCLGHGICKKTFCHLDSFISRETCQAFNGVDFIGQWSTNGRFKVADKEYFLSSWHVDFTGNLRTSWLHHSMGNTSLFSCDARIYLRLSLSDGDLDEYVHLRNQRTSMNIYESDKYVHLANLIDTGTSDEYGHLRNQGKFYENLWI